MTIGNTKNKISRDINNAVYQARLRGPSAAERQQWYREFLESGAQYRMSYSAFQKGRLREFNRKKYLMSLNKKKQ